MDQTIGAAVYFVLALAIAVGIRAVFTKAGTQQELNLMAASDASPQDGNEVSGESQQFNDPEHGLPWVSPQALDPNTNYRPPLTCEEISEIFKKIDFELSQISKLASDNIGSGWALQANQPAK